MSTKMPPLRLNKQLQDFKTLKKGFDVVYSTRNHNSLNISKLCILDSSFNPPTKGHFTLVKKSIDHYTQKIGTPKDQLHLVLLLAINNADKLPKPAQFESRLDMMALFADHIHQQFQIPVTVALTSHPKFVDKGKVLEEWAKSWISDLSNVKFSFLVGFDTLIRIFNPKYYVPTPISEALDEFVQKNDFICLTRSDESIDDITKQYKYIQDISDGNTDLPTSWVNKIQLVENDPDALSISSSDVRDGIASSDASWESNVTNEVADYIINEKIYL